MKTHGRASSLQVYSRAGLARIDASKSDVAGRRIDRLRMACGRPVATAIIRRAQMRAAFQNFPGNSDLRLTGIEARLLATAARILGNAARLRRVRFMLLRVPVGRPLPDVSDHVVNAIAVRRKSRNRRGAIKTIGAEILLREFALPGVGKVLASGRELVAPGIFSLVQSAARREFPFRLGRQILAGPSCVGERVGIGDVHHRMFVERVDVAFRSIRMPPVSTLHELPPLAPVAEINGPRRRRKHQRTGIDHMRQRAGIVLRIGRDFGESDVAGRPHEILELPVRHRRAVDCEFIDGNAMNGRFVGIVLVRSHAERAAGNPQHAVNRSTRTVDRRNASHRHSPSVAGSANNAAIRYSR